MLRRCKRSFTFTVHGVNAEKGLTLFPNPFPIGRDEIEAARDLVMEHTFLGARDAIHAAVVQTNDLDGIITGDKVFDRIKGIERFAIK